MSVFTGHIRRLCLALVCSTALGCSQGPETGSQVEGTITYNGKPLRGGKVLFKAVQPGGRISVATAFIDEEGQYHIMEGPVGKVLVAVDTEAVKEQVALQVDPSSLEAHLKKMAERYVVIPARYRDFEQSGLTLELKPGSQVQDLTVSKN